MGTNYYLHCPTCPTCGRKSDPVHIGKQSAGWPFIFRAYFDWGDESYCTPDPLQGSINSWEMWQANLEFIADHPKFGVIRNEYGATIDPTEFVQMVLRSRHTVPPEPVGREWELRDGFIFTTVNFS